MERKKEAKLVLFILVIFACFLLFSYLSKVYSDEIRIYIGYSISGMIFYIILINLDVVLAPISVIPLIPIATSIWGWQIAGLLTLLGWTMGSIIVFFITREYGVPVIKKLTNIEYVWKIQRAIPEKNLLFGIILIRIFIPFDIMSYAISLFTKVKMKTYATATFIGFAAPAFILAYIGGFNLYTQLIIALIGIVIIIIFSLLLYFESKVRKKVLKKLKKTFMDE